MHRAASSEERGKRGCVCASLSARERAIESVYPFPSLPASSLTHAFFLDVEACAAPPPRRGGLTWRERERALVRCGDGKKEAGHHHEQCAYLALKVASGGGKGGKAAARGCRCIHTVGGWKEEGSRGAAAKGKSRRRKQIRPRGANRCDGSAKVTYTFWFD